MKIKLTQLLPTCLAATLFLSSLPSTTHARTPVFRNRGLDGVALHRNSSFTRTKPIRLYCSHRDPGCKPDGVVVSQSTIDSYRGPESNAPEQILAASPAGLIDITSEALRGIEKPNVYSAAGRIANGHTKDSCVADFNADGFEDILLVNRMGRHRLLFNNAPKPGLFRDATPQLNELGRAGLNLSNLSAQALEEHVSSGQSGQYATRARRCATGDLDGDGLIDILIAHSGMISAAMSRAENRELPMTTIQAFYNTRETPGVFRDLSRTLEWLDPAERAGPGPRIPLANIVIEDLNQDARPDLILLHGPETSETNPRHPHQVLLNQGGGIFSLRQARAFPGPDESLFFSTDAQLMRANGRTALTLLDPLGSPRVFEFDRKGAILREHPARNLFSGKIPSGTAKDPLVRLIAINERVPMRGYLALKRFSLDFYTLKTHIGSPLGLRLVHNPIVTSKLQSLKQNADISLIDADRNGMTDLHLVGSSYGRMLYNRGTHFVLASRSLTASDMNPSAAAADVNGDGLTDYLMPGYRNFSSLLQDRRNLPNRIYLQRPDSHTLQDATQNLPQPKLSNFTACLAEAPAGLSPEALSQYLFNCDRPEACVEELMEGCPAAKLAQVQGGCSWNSRRSSEYRNACIATCTFDCSPEVSANLDSPHYDPDAAAAVQGAVNYCGMNGSCQATCSTPMDPAQTAWRRMFESPQFQNPDNAYMMVEESGHVVPIDFDGDRDMDLVSSDNHQGLRLFENDGTGRFSKLPASRLPCPLAAGQGGVQVVDIDRDQRPDLLVIRKERAVEAWLNRYTPESREGPGAYFVQANIRPAGETKTYKFQPFGNPSGDLAAFVFSSIRAVDGQSYFTLKKMLEAGVTVAGLPNPYRSSELELASGGRASLACLNHRTREILQPCPENLLQVRRATPQWGAIQVVGVVDINGDGASDVVAGPTGWSEPMLQQLEETGFLSPVLTLLLGNHADPAVSTYADASSQLLYLPADGTPTSHLDPATGVDRQVQRVAGFNFEDFDGDGDPDLLVVDFAKLIYFENLGRDCWRGLAATPGARCMVQRTERAFPGGGHGYDGLYGPKNYGATAGDFNGDGRKDFMLRAAGEDLLFEQQPYPGRLWESVPGGERSVPNPPAILRHSFRRD